MANMIQDAKDSVNALLAAACQKAAEKGQLPAGAVLTGTVEIPKDSLNGDYAANHAMTGARALHMAPRKIAEALIENLDLTGSWFSSVEVAGPGFINFRLSPAWYAGSLSFSIAAARLFIGDMGTGRAYQLERRWDGRTRTTHIPIQEQHEYNYLKNLRSVTIYSDYAPRLEGDPRYQASDQPVVTMSLDLVPNNGMRSNYRDRFYVMSGLSVCEAFYQPDYSKQKLPEKQKDYRRTLYWNPFLRLDESGRATVSFYNNSRQNQFSVSAEGITENGMILTSEISGQ